MTSSDGEVRCADVDRSPMVALFVDSHVALVLRCGRPIGNDGNTVGCRNVCTDL
jgi:hypothetical protein